MKPRVNSPVYAESVRRFAARARSVAPNTLSVPRAALWEAVAEALTLGAVALLALTALVLFG